MNKEDIVNIIVSTIIGEEHLGENLKKQCIDYFDGLHEKYQQLKEIEKEHQRINGELRVENKELKGSLQTYEILLKTNIEENQELKDRIENLKRDKQMLEITVEKLTKTPYEYSVR